MHRSRIAFVVPHVLAALTFAAAAAPAARAQCGWTCGPGYTWTFDAVGIGGAAGNSALGVLTVGNGYAYAYDRSLVAIQYATEGIAVDASVQSGGPLGGEPHGASIAVRGTNPSPSGTAIRGVCTATTGLPIALSGEVDVGKAVAGYANAKSGTSWGVIGVSNSSSGYGVYGSSANIGVLGHTWGADTYAVYGACDQPSAYAGYFDGKGYFDGFLGVGRTTQVSSAEVFGIYKDTSGYGGMYVQTSGSAGKPFYGYSAGGGVDAFTYYSSDNWRVYVSGDKLSVNGTTGNVGIGTNSPAFLLHVNGSAGKPGGGSWSVASDVRLKKDIEPLDGALDRLLSIRGVSFEYVDPDAIGELPGRQLGVTAQDVEREFPGWVNTGADGYERVTFRGFEGVAVEAIRELRAEKDAAIARLEARVAELVPLEARVAELEQMVRALAAR